MEFLFYEYKGLLVRDNQSVSLTKQEGKLLTALVRSHGDLVSYDRLCHWLYVNEDKWDVFIEGNQKTNYNFLWLYDKELIRQLVIRLRRKIRNVWLDCDPFSIIITYRGRGLSVEGIALAQQAMAVHEYYIDLPVPVYRLTPNQEKILRAYSQESLRNLSERELANYLSMNYYTFRDHRRKLYKELEVERKVDAVVIAMSVYRERSKSHAI